MDEDTKRALVLGAGALAGGWLGASAVNRLGARFGMRVGAVGVIAGAALGAFVGVRVGRQLLGEPEELSVELDESLEAEPEAAGGSEVS